MLFYTRICFVIMFPSFGCIKKVGNLCQNAARTNGCLCSLSPHINLIKSIQSIRFLFTLRRKASISVLSHYVVKYVNRNQTIVWKLFSFLPAQPKSPSSEKSQLIWYLRVPFNLFWCLISCSHIDWARH